MRNTINGVMRRLASADPYFATATPSFSSAKSESRGAERELGHVIVNGKRYWKHALTVVTVPHNSLER